MTTPALAQGNFTAHPNGVQFLQAMVANDVQTYVRGGKSLLQYPTLPRITISASAPQLWQDYNANELSAENKYAGKGIEISGIVYTVARDPLGVPYVEYASAIAMMGNVRARLADDTVGEASTYKPGQNLVLDCTNVEKGFLSPELTRCRSSSALQTAELQTADDTVSKFMRGETLQNETPKLRKSLFVTYWIGSTLPPGCALNPGDEDCLSKFKATGSQLKNNRQFEAAYTAAADALHLPAWKSAHDAK